MPLNFRQATVDDLPALVGMLADDPLGARREDLSNPINHAYAAAFDHIFRDNNNELMVAEYKQKIAGMMQLTFIPYLSHTGSWRCLIEAVRIHSDYRGKGFGHRFFEWAIQRAADRQCRLVQLTSDKKRPDAIRFYEQLGFVASHEGFKLVL